MIALWILPLAGLIGAATPVSASLTGDELAHDDGKQDDPRSSAGAGHVVRFERPSQEFVLTGVRLHGSRYGVGYEPEWALARVQAHDQSRQVLASGYLPHAAWKVGRAEWVEAPLEALRVREAFFVSVGYFPTQRRGIDQSIDRDNSGHSFGLARGGLGSALEGEEWMLRVIGNEKAPRLERPDPRGGETLARGEGPMLDKQSTAGAGQALPLGRPSRSRC